MARILLVAATFFGVLLAVLLARLPLGLLVDRAPDRLVYDRVEGSVWNGRILGAEVDGEPVGDVDVSLKALPLFAGRLVADVALGGGAATGAGTVALVGRSLELTDATAHADLAPFTLYDMFGRGLRGEVDISVERLAYGPEGCRAAELTLRTDALVKSLGVYAPADLILEGRGRCEGGDVVVPLQATSDIAAVSAELRLQPTGRYVTLLKVIPKDRSLGTFLESAGFERRGDAYVTARGGQVVLSL